LPASTKGQCGRGEYQLNDHLGGKDGLRAQRRSAEPLEDAAFAVDGDNGDQRDHCVDGNQKRCKNGETHADKTVGCERGRVEPAADNPTHHKESQNRDNDGAERAHRLTHEDLDLKPTQFPEPTQHHSRSYSRME